MSELEIFRNWVMGYPGMPPVITTDFSDVEPHTGSVSPRGISELSRTEDVLGNITVTCRANFQLSFTFPKSGGGDETALRNAEWLLGFQSWVREQSARGAIPAFGNYGTTEISAVEGIVRDRPDHGVGVYTVEVGAVYKVRYVAPDPANSPD